MDHSNAARRRRRLTLWLAVFGLVIALAFAAYFDTDPRLKSPAVLRASLASLFLCPGSFLFVTFIDAEPGTGGFWLMWIVIGLINFGIYGAIGAAIGRLLWKSR
jgi:EamA domain-containing membrane protein RarD